MNRSRERIVTPNRDASCPAEPDGRRTDLIILASYNARSPTQVTCPICDGEIGPAGHRGRGPYGRCPSCDIYALVPQPTRGALASHYSAMYQQGNYRLAHEHRRSNQRKFGRLIVDALREYRRLGLPPPRSVLDIGCFDGVLLDVAATYGLATYGFDTMSEAVAGASDRHVVWSGALDACAAGPDKFDMIVMSDVVEHVATPEEYFAWTASHLAPDGLLFVTTPDVNSWVGKALGSRWGVFDGREHLILYTRRALERTLGAAGLQTVAIRSHWKTLTFDYFVSIALHWQFRTSSVRRALPAWLRNMPVRVNVGEMMAVARLARSG
jgi:2-polyprenyl-3-methyl-5-hydroxy-6-metoxy-1,4-benzoquinol methylase